MDSIFKQWRSYILTEATRADKEGVKLPDMIETLEQYASDDELRPSHFITFHEVNKVGINPSTPYDTPIGIYTYPLTRGLVRQIKEGTVPFASDARYISILEPKPETNIMSITNEPGLNEFVKLFSQETVDRFNLQGGALEKDVMSIDKAVQEMGEPLPSYPRWRAIFAGAAELYNMKARRKNNFAKLWKITWHASNKDPSTWNAMLRYLGYDAAYDSNSGIIHPKEKQQAVFFSRSAIDIVTTMPNKMQKKIVQAKKREKQYGIKFKRQKHTDY